MGWLFANQNDIFLRPFIKQNPEKGSLFKAWASSYRPLLGLYLGSSMVIILLIKKAEIYISIQHSLERKILMTGILIFRVVTEPRNSGKSAKSREIHNNTKMPRNSVKILWNTCLYNIFETFFSATYQKPWNDADSFDDWQPSISKLKTSQASKKSLRRGHPPSWLKVEITWVHIGDMDTCDVFSFDKDGCQSSQMSASVGFFFQAML